MLPLTALFLPILIISTADNCTVDRALHFLQSDYGLMCIGQIEGLILMSEVGPSCFFHHGRILRCAVPHSTASDVGFGEHGFENTKEKKIYPQTSITKD